MSSSVTTMPVANRLPETPRPQRRVDSTLRSRSWLGLGLSLLLALGCSPAEFPSPSSLVKPSKSSQQVPKLADQLRLVQTGSPPTSPVEVIPAPEPDSTATPEPGAAATPSPIKSDQELVPTPVGVPDKSAASQPAPTQPTQPAPTQTDPGQSLPDDSVDTVIAATQGPTGPEDFKTWPKPAVALVVTGQQHGYIEPCGCTGLDRQKGGVARRFTFLEELRERGWEVLPIDAGNQVRRFGRQAEIKFQQTAEALRAMQYRMVGFGPDDVRLGVGELLAVVAADTPETALYASANVSILDPSLMPQHKVVSAGGMRIGMTSVLDPKALEASTTDEILIEDPTEAARKAIGEMDASSLDFRVLTFFGKEEAAQQLVRDVPGFDLVVVAGGYGEPTYKPQSIDGSDTQMIVTGSKGMYAGIVALYRDAPLRYARVPLTHEFQDAPEMRQLMQNYQDQLKAVGLDGLGLKPIPHPSGEKFIGSETCGECHKSAYEIWQYTAHAEATDHIVEPPKERGDIARHHDPECISCHVTGWNPQNYYPYESGYLALDQSNHLTGNGCENCHGPGASHSEAEREGSGASEDLLLELRLAMQLPLEKARERCMECHDLDNSPDFHLEDAFEDVYWPQVEHYGVD